MIPTVFDKNQARARKSILCQELQKCGRESLGTDKRSIKNFQILSPRNYIFDVGDKIRKLSPTFHFYIPNKAENMVDKYPSRYKFNSSYSQGEKQF